VFWTLIAAGRPMNLLGYAVCRPVILRYRVVGVRLLRLAYAPFCRQGRARPPSDSDLSIALDRLSHFRVLMLSPVRSFACSG